MGKKAGEKRKIPRRRGGSDPGAARTRGRQIRNLLLYPTELRDHRRFDGRKIKKKKHTNQQSGCEKSERAIFLTLAVLLFPGPLAIFVPWIQPKDNVPRRIS